MEKLNDIYTFINLQDIRVKSAENDIIQIIVKIKEKFMLKKFNLALDGDNDYYCLQYDIKRAKVLKTGVACDQQQTQYGVLCSSEEEGDSDNDYKQLQCNTKYQDNNYFQALTPYTTVQAQCPSIC